MEIKFCRKCKKPLKLFDGYQHVDGEKEWGDPEKIFYFCRDCENEYRMQEMKDQILSGEEDNPYSDILGSDGYYCPYCGEWFEINDDYELFEDGSHDVVCPDCNKNFVLNTHVSYSFDSEMEEQNNGK